MGPPASAVLREQWLHDFVPFLIVAPGQPSRTLPRGTGKADTVYEQLLAADFGSFGNADNRHALVGKARHHTASQAKEMRMAARTALRSRLVENVAKGSIDALHAMD
jgi:hypothetical protein